MQWVVFIPAWLETGKEGLTEMFVQDMEGMGWNQGRMKKCRVLLFSLLLLCVACGRGKGQQEGHTPTPPQEGMEDVARIVVTYQTMENSVLTDFDEVVAAINAITIPEIGVEVIFRKVGAIEAFTEYSLWISRGEQIDLMMLNYQDITSYVNRGMILPIDGYLEQEGDAIRKLVEEGINPMEASVMDGRTYGVASVQRIQGNGGGIWTKASYLEETGISYQEKHIYTFEELGEIFAALKEQYPDRYPLGQITSGINASTVSYYLNDMDAVGGDLMGGVVPKDSGDYQVINYFASGEYADFLKYMRKWYLAGYIYPDAAFTDTSQSELLLEGVIMSYPRNSTPGLAPKEWMDGELVCLRTSIPISMAQYAKTGFWVIPVTSKEPEAAMRFLNLLYADGRIGNLLNLGIEGRHYVVTDEENGIAAYPDGINMENVGFHSPLGLYGDYRNQYMLGTLSDKEAELAYAKEAQKNTVERKMRGVPYSNANVSKEFAAVSEVVAEYVPLLESGSVDIEKYYPEFLKRLEMAGINDIIADKQKQLDEWILQTSDLQD